jgi:hypothetical protein
MADYYTNFSLILRLANEAQRNEALQLAQQASHVRGTDEPPADFPEALRDVVENWFFETDPGQEATELRLHSDNGGIDAVCAFIQHLLVRFQPEGCVTFQWSHDCSQPRTDAYGGGAAVVTASQIKTLTTADWLREQTNLNPQPERKT